MLIDYPALSPKQALLRRIDDGAILSRIDARARDYWFGPPSEVTDQVLGLLSTAMQQIRGVIAGGTLSPTRKVLHGQAPVIATGPALALIPVMAHE